MSIFREHAWGYDLLYRDKPYADEAAFVDGMIREQLPARDRGDITLLDLACGTGRHALQWQTLGYHVEGCEPSEDMRQVARGNADRAGTELVIHPHGFEQCERIGRTYDVITCMFNSLGYLVDLEALRLGLRNIASLLAPGGLFVFDHWNGLAVPRHHSPVKALDVRDGERSVHRVSRTVLDLLEATAEVSFDLMLVDADRIASRTTERHLVRYFTPTEARLLLEASGFEIARCVPFLEPSRSPTADDWNLTIVARRKTP